MPYKLTYFNERGRAEPIRLIFKWANQSFEDVRLNDQEFVRCRKSFPNWQLPVLEFEGHMLSQSGAIIRFLAQKLNLVGQNELEAARADEVFGVYQDRFNEQLQYFLHKVGDSRFKNGEKLYNEVFVPSAKKALEYYASILYDKSQQFVLESGPSYADFALAEHLETIFEWSPEFKNQYPQLLEYQNCVYSLEPIAEYIKTRKHTVA